MEWKAGPSSMFQMYFAECHLFLLCTPFCVHTNKVNSPGNNLVQQSRAVVRAGSFVFFFFNRLEGGWLRRYQSPLAQ
ncbi:hypothetical protein ACRRTK_024732 [Alexandromys fortis]